MTLLFRPHTHRLELPDYSEYSKIWRVLNVVEETTRLDVYLGDKLNSAENMNLDNLIVFEK